MGGKSRTQSESNVSQVTETTSTGLQDTEGFAVAGGGDVEVNLQTTDAGAVQGAFDFGSQFGESAFEFAGDALAQNAELAERAAETSQAALATVATGGQTDLSKIDGKTIAIAVAALAAVFVIPQLIRRAA